MGCRCGTRWGWWLGCVWLCSGTWSRIFSGGVISIAKSAARCLVWTSSGCFFTVSSFISLVNTGSISAPGTPCSPGFSSPAQRASSTLGIAVVSTTTDSSSGPLAAFSANAGHELYRRPVLHHSSSSHVIPFWEFFLHQSLHTFDRI